MLRLCAANVLVFQFFCVQHTVLGLVLYMVMDNLILPIRAKGAPSMLVSEPQIFLIADMNRFCSCCMQVRQHLAG